MRQYLTLSLLILLSFSSNAQLSDGTLAPDFTLDDWQWGNTHNLYDYLDDGKSVILDFGATWCSPCWNYHQSGVLEALYEDFGPDGTDQIMVFMIEGDDDTTQNCIEDDPGCIGGTIGDWTDVQYPILNPPAAAANDISGDYGINFWPTLYGIAPNGEVYLIGQAGYDEWESFTVHSFQLVNSTFDIVPNGCSFDVELSPVGGFGDLEYEWSNGFVGQNLINVSGEEFFVTITDDNGFEAELGPIDVPQGDGHELELIETIDLICNNDFSGSIEVEAFGGSGSFSYDWSNGASGPIIFDLESGEISVWVTDNNNGCTSESYFYIEEPDPLEVGFEIEEAGCEEVGTAYFDATGGTGPYEYEFEDFTTSFNEVELEPGTYDVTITDVNNCEILDNFTIASTEPPVASSSASSDINCTNTSITLMSTGSTTGSDIEYYWFDADNNIIGTDPSIIVSNGGMYTLEVFDGESGCSNMDVTTVAINNTVPTAASSYSNTIDCTNLTSTLSGAGSSSGPNIIYSWSTTDGNILTEPSMPTVEVGSGGLYTLTILDSMNGCSSNSMVTVPANGNIPSSSLNGNTSFCDGSSTQICIANPADNIINWVVDGAPIVDTGTCITVASSAEVQATVTDPSSGCSSTETTTVTSNALPDSNITGTSEFCIGSSTNLCVNLQAGETVEWQINGSVIPGATNCVIVADAGEVTANVLNGNNCESSSTIIVNAISAPSANITGNTILCDNSTTALCTDDIAGHTYSWINETGQVLGDMACLQTNVGGQITVMVTNENSCMALTNTIVVSESSPTITITPPAILDCTTSEVILNATTTGGTINWFDASGNMLAQGDSFTTNLAGTYTASSISPNGCMTTESVDVQQDDNALPISDFQTDVSDFSVFFVNESTGNVTTYLWDFGDGNTSTEENPSYTYSAAGTYTVCLTVTNDCGSNSVCENLSFSNVLSVGTTVNDISCFGANDATIIIDISGGVAPFTITTNPDIGSSEVLTEVQPGDYEITVMDSAGETNILSVTIDEPSEILVSGTVTDAVGGDANGSIDITVTGGNEDGYTYAWSNGASTALVENLIAGEYSVIVTDSNGCNNMEEFTVGSISTVDKISIVEEFNVMPNPATDFINIDLRLYKADYIKLEILNSMGVSVYNAQISRSKNVDVSGLANGIYIIYLSHENQGMSKKLLIVD